MKKNLLKIFLVVFAVSQIGTVLHAWSHPIGVSEEFHTPSLELMACETEHELSEEDESRHESNHLDCRIFHFSERTDFHLDIPVLKITHIDKILNDLSDEPERLFLQLLQQQSQPRAPPKNS